MHKFIAHDQPTRGRRPFLSAKQRGAFRPWRTMLAIGLMGAAPLVVADEEAMLAPVTVKAAADQPDVYRASKTRVGKVVQDPHDIPQAITTVTRALIEEQEANSLREALRNVSGLTFNAAEGGRSGDNMNLRGFYTFGDMYLDGIRDTAQYNREVFNTEQVDVLRGAAAMLFGRGQAGGVINQVSKTPMLLGMSKLGVGIGSEGFQEVRADLNQRLGETTALRLNLMTRDEGSSRSNPYTGTEPEIHRQGFAPSIAFGLGTAHEVTFSHLWTKTQDRADYGVPFVSGQPDQAMAKAGHYYGGDGNFDDSQTNVSTLNYLFKISPDTQWRTVLRAANYQRAYWAVAGQGVLTANSTQQQAKTRQFETDNLVLQSDLNTAFTLFGMKNELVTGVEYLHEDSIRWALRNLGTVTEPLYKPGEFTTAPANTYRGETYSAYVQDTLEFVPDWRLTVGVRRDQMKSDYVTVSGGVASAFSGNFGENSYRAGLSWQPTAAAHYYAGWSDSFSPTADLYQLSGSQYPAERSQVYEIGAKWLLLDGDLALRTALYHAHKAWERNTDLESTAAILTKKRESNGLEIELAGRLSERWEVFSGLSWIDAAILEASPSAPDNSAVGQTPRNTPKLTSNLWATYDLGWGFKLGGGFEYKGKRTGFVPTRTYSAPNTIPSYVRWDAMLAYEQPKYTVRFNIQNLFDKLYYDALYDNGGFTVPGQSRRFILSTEYKF
ncbi:MAG: TonB-dependent siderophore receptor [Dechloromonas sp.]|nr:TonB-dependent siderophore receptor [Dechloromonas sp.]